MDEKEKRHAKMVRERLNKILPDLKVAYDNAKTLEFEYNWDMNCFGISDAYATLAEAYIRVMEELGKEDEGGEK